MNDFINYIIHAPETLTALQKLGIAYVIFFIIGYIFQRKVRIIILVAYSITFLLYSLDWTMRKTDVVNVAPKQTKTNIEKPNIEKPKKEEIKNVSNNPNIKIEVR